MNTHSTSDQVLPGAVQKKAFEAPVVRREARLVLVTAGSFDLRLP